jgi:hypothetical protein
MSTSLSLPQLVSFASSIAAKLISQKPSQYLPSVYSSTPLFRGFKAQHKILAEWSTSTSVAVSQFPVVGLLHTIEARLPGTTTLNPADPQGSPSSSTTRS